MMNPRLDDQSIDIDFLPELDTIVGMTGAMVEVEVGGQVCLDSGILIVASLI